MTFAEMLARYTKGKTLESVVAACAERGVKIGRVTLSRYRSGDRYPPSDERTVRIIAEACGKDPEPLVFSWLVSRYPEQILQQVLECLTVAQSGRPPETLNDFLDSLPLLRSLPVLKQDRPSERPVTVEVRVNGNTVAYVAHSPGTALTVEQGESEEENQC